MVKLVFPFMKYIKKNCQKARKKDAENINTRCITNVHVTKVVSPVINSIDKNVVHIVPGIVAGNSIVFECKLYWLGL